MMNSLIRISQRVAPGRGLGVLVTLDHFGHCHGQSIAEPLFGADDSRALLNPDFYLNIVNEVLIDDEKACAQIFFN